MGVAYHIGGYCILCRYRCISNIVILLYVVYNSWWMANEHTLQLIPCETLLELLKSGDEHVDFPWQLAVLPRSLVTTLSCICSLAFVIAVPVFTSLWSCAGQSIYILCCATGFVQHATLSCFAIVSSFHVLTSRTLQLLITTYSLTVNEIWLLPWWWAQMRNLWWEVTNYVLYQTLSLVYLQGVGWSCLLQKIVYIL